ncbi:MAG: hypothetical protein C5B52_02080 [Bacteroidetes bacterium]|nr:MAG: hypothetical protein C5B52_02080 [Bacteroidota bacterium]
MKRIFLVLLMIACAGPFSTAYGQNWENDFSYLDRQYDLAKPHDSKTHYFLMQSDMLIYSPDGKRQDSTTFILYMRCDPAQKPDEADMYTCLKYVIRKSDKDTVSIPSLAGWKYPFIPEDSNSPTRTVLGIPHEPFEKLNDSRGKPLSPEISYFVYNTFVDFHTMNVFADKTKSGPGIQNLHQLGDIIVHGSAFSEPPVDLGKDVAKGSFFKNGKITLEFKGIGSIDKNPCAILGYDSGESSFVMLMTPMPNFQIKTTGSSHYWGDIYKSLHDGWIRNASLHEIVVSETELPGNGQKIHSIIERQIKIAGSAKQIF